MKLFGRKKPRNYFTGPATVRMLDAVLRDDGDGVRAAVANGADPNAVGRDGITPLTFCLFYPKKLRGIEALLDAGADPNYKDPAPDGPPSVLGLAVQGKGAHAEMFKLLIRKGGNPTFISGGRLSTTNALLSDRFDTLFWLLDNGSDINAREFDGDTVLFYALRLSRWEVVLELLKRGARVDVANVRGGSIAYSFESGVPGEDFLQQNPERREVVERVRQALIAAGVRFPALTPEQVRAKWDEQGGRPSPPVLPADE